MIVYEDERGRQSAAEKYGGPFVLYREYLGGLVPLLRGDKISKVRPEFVVYNPQEDNSCSPLNSDGLNGCAVPGGCYWCHEGAFCFGGATAAPTGIPRQKSGVSLLSSPGKLTWCCYNNVAEDIIWHDFQDNSRMWIVCRVYVSPWLSVTWLIERFWMMNVPTANQLILAHWTIKV